MSPLIATLAHVLDLVLPLECGGCGAPATRWCPACAREMTLRPDQPHVVVPRVDPGVPVFSLGRYAGVRRTTIIAAKERGRADLIAPLAAMVSGGVRRLRRWGVLAGPLTLVPAPTRGSAARRRGGDPITRIGVAAAAGRGDVALAPALRLHAFTRDSVGLSPAERLKNISGRVRLRRGWAAPDGEVLLIDDVVTTGATSTESVRVLQSADAAVVAVLAIAHA